MVSDNTKEKSMKTEYFVGELNGVPIICVKITKGSETISRPLTRTELELLIEEVPKP